MSELAPKKDGAACKRTPSPSVGDLAGKLALRLRDGKHDEEAIDDPDEGAERVAHSHQPRHMPVRELCHHRLDTSQGCLQCVGSRRQAAALRIVLATRRARQQRMAAFPVVARAP